MKKKALAAVIGAMLCAGAVPVPCMAGEAAAEDESMVIYSQSLNDTADREVSYKIVALPDKVEYKLGEVLSLKGLKIEMTRDGEEPVVCTDHDMAFAHDSNTPRPPKVLLFTDFRSNKAGTYEVGVIGGDNVSFEVSVVDDPMLSGTTETVSAAQTDVITADQTMTATVLEVSGQTLLLQSVERSRELMTLSTKYLDSDIVPKAGMKLGITYAGGILETYPAQFGGVRKTAVISERTETIKGDANCDSSFDLADAILIMQALANPNKYGEKGSSILHLTELGRANADMNGDGLTVGDAQEIQRELLGISDTDIYNSSIAGKTYVYEKEGTGSEFTITFRDDETFEYYTGAISSYIGGGTWEIKDDTVVMTENTSDKVHHLKMQGSDLVYIADESDNFYGISVKDGEKFFVKADND